ncbi:MAG: hypothetical protein V3U54_13130 [Thermodesulfobacteriota bacterium]
MTKRKHKFEVSPQRKDIENVKAVTEKNVLHSIIFELYNSGYKPAPISKELDINHYTIRGLLNKRNDIVRNEQEDLFDGISILSNALMSYVEILKHKGLQGSAKQSLQQLSNFLNGGYTSSINESVAPKEIENIKEELKFIDKDELELNVPVTKEPELIDQMESLLKLPIEETIEEIVEEKPSKLELMIASAVENGQLSSTSKRGRKSSKQKDSENILMQHVKATAAKRGIVLGRGRPSPAIQDQLKAIETEIKAKFNLG